LKKVKTEFEIQIPKLTDDSKQEAEKIQHEKEVLGEQFIHLKAQDENMVGELRVQIDKLKPELEKERVRAFNFEQESNHKLQEEIGHVRQESEQKNKELEAVITQLRLELENSQKIEIQFKQSVSTKDKLIIELYEKIGNLETEISHKEIELDENKAHFLTLIEKKDEEIERLKIDVQRELPSVDIKEKPVDKTKACNHGPQIRELQGKVEELEGDIFLKESEIDI